MTVQRYRLKQYPDTSVVMFTHEDGEYYKRDDILQLIKELGGDITGSIEVLDILEELGATKIEADW